MNLMDGVNYVFEAFLKQQQPYPVNPTNSKATYRVWGGWDVWGRT